jgi:hypothetical protein
VSNKEEEIELSDEEIAEAEAALTLALLPEGDRLPGHVRDRVASDAKSFLDQRAKLHAQTRAESRARSTPPPAARSLQSTTSAGSQVVSAFDQGAAPAPRSRSSALFGWGGWALAAAAGMALFLAPSRAPSRGGPAGGGAPSASLAVDAVALRGPGDARGELRYERSEGTGRVTLKGAPTLDPERESLQLWIAFVGDTSPRPVALLGGGATEAFGAGQPVCVSPRATGDGEPRCAAVREVVVTRETRQGALVLAPERVVLRSGPAR